LRVWVWVWVCGCGCGCVGASVCAPWVWVWCVGVVCGCGCVGIFRPSTTAQDTAAMRCCILARAERCSSIPLTRDAASLRGNFVRVLLTTQLACDAAPRDGIRSTVAGVGRGVCAGACGSIVRSGVIAHDAAAMRCCIPARGFR
jgi:hypothetical protein